MHRRRFVGQGLVGACTLARLAALRAQAPRLPAQPALAQAQPGPSGSATAAAMPPQYLSWDAGSGPDRALWSQKLQLPWVHAGAGDWLDARAQPQGPTPHARCNLRTGTLALEVTTLVQHWLATGQVRGFYLRSSEAFAATLAGRLHGVSGQRPTLLLQTSSGQRALPCLCNANWSPSAYGGTDSRARFAVAAGNWFAALHFDLTGVEAPLLQARLQLHCLEQSHGGQLELMELDAPRFQVGGGDAVPRWGLARSFVLDRGLAAHPDVLFVADFADLSRRQWQVGHVQPGTQVLRDGRTGSMVLHGLIGAGQQLGCDLQHNVVGGRSDGTPSGVETELYARYHLLLEQDWGSEVDANKMPGWDARMGWWNSAGYWQNTTGNGGVPCTGLKVRNARQQRWEYEGASMRGYGGTRSNDGNPYDALFWLGSYMEHLDQGGVYGEPMPWPGVVIDTGRWHSIEQRIRMNSISGPFDALGNGQAVRDGQYDVWMDGVPVFERRNLAWRRHPEMGVQGFWLDWYHGGMRPPTHDLRFRMDALVLARSYIGPRSG